MAGPAVSSAGIRVLPPFLMPREPASEPRCGGHRGEAKGAGVWGLLGVWGVLGLWGWLALGDLTETQQFLQQEAARLRLPRTTRYGVRGHFPGWSRPHVLQRPSPTVPRPQNSPRPPLLIPQPRGVTVPTPHPRPCRFPSSPLPIPKTLQPQNHASGPPTPQLSSSRPYWGPTHHLWGSAMEPAGRTRRRVTGVPGTDAGHGQRNRVSPHPPPQAPLDPKSLSALPTR